ncbi:hypothetical protein OG401_39465 [Kitasatospora purpeofusca]|nr:hypothetical protein [Kitasatospora purpeofusca]
MDGLTVTVAGYSCRDNGSTHAYGLVMVSLPEPLSQIEVRHEPAFRSTLVVEPDPGGRVRTGVAAFDARYEVYTSDPYRRTGLSVAETETLPAAPVPFSWRVHGRDAMLWRSDGWSSADEVLGSVRAVVAVLRPAPAWWPRTRRHPRPGDRAPADPTRPGPTGSDPPRCCRGVSTGLLIGPGAKGPSGSRQGCVRAAGGACRGAAGSRWMVDMNRSTRHHDRPPHPRSRVVAVAVATVR